MKRISIMFATLLFLFSSGIFAEANYKGLIVAHIVEASGDIYRGYDGFTNGGEFKDKQIIYFSQERGQKVALNNKKVLVDSSTEHKYHMLLTILDRKDDKFTAELSFFSNIMEYLESKQEYALVSTLIRKATIEGILNTDNKYTFVDDNQPNYKVSINIDRIFTREEILSRLEAKMAAKL